MDRKRRAPAIFVVLVLLAIGVLLLLKSWTPTTPEPTPVELEPAPAPDATTGTGGRRQATAGQSTEKGTLVVAGTGHNQCEVRDAAGKEWVNSLRTSNEIALPPGTYTLILNGARKTVTVPPGGKVTAAAGSLAVLGTGNDLYDVYDASGKNKLQFGDTNGEFELFPGDYTVCLNHTPRRVTVAVGRKTTLQAGVLFVAGEGKNLYHVYDAAGAKKLDFKFVNGETELFPGEYVVVVGKHRSKVTIAAGQRTEVKP